ncbi:MAG TPA: PIG-L family deacetylase [Candidatus Angelobacter sp.]|nr:PIG-L family deacetylase [Candidatus Angelobacter sp.]
MATIMAVLAHPDDETFICGGTLAKYGHEGHRVVLVSATKGEMGRRMGVPPIETRESIPIVREQELRNACNALKIEDLRFLGIRDKLVEIQPFDELKQTVLDHLLDVKPDIVITFHEVLGGHPDHCAIGKATQAAFLNYQEQISKAQLFYLCWKNVADNASSYGLSPDQITKIEVSPYNRNKLQAFRAHKTQSGMDDWLWKRDEVSVRRFGSHEYFIQAFPPYRLTNSLV